MSCPTRISRRLLAALAAGLTVLGGALRAQPLVNPTFANVTVHDPSVVRDGGTFWVFGSHMASASTTDLMAWTQFSTSAAAPNPLARGSAPRTEFAEALAYAQADTFWAPDVIQLGDGKFYYYYCACQGSMPLAVLGLAKADAVNGPYQNVGILLRSMGASPTVSPYNATIHPNVVDPAVFFDADGVLRMVYGSYSGGLFMLQLDQTVGSPTIGQPLPGQGYGTKLLGGNHAPIEGGYIIYSPETKYYYLFTSFGGLAANGGYNIRVFRAQAPTGPFFDATGNNMATTYIPNNATATIAPYGVKLVGNYEFVHVAGEPQQTMRGYVSPGHNSVYRDPTTGRYSIVFHTRFVGRGEIHEVRVHQLWLNDQGWFVMAPQRYAGETIAKITARQVPGDFKVIEHGKDITAAVKMSSVATFNADGTISGAMSGTWQLSGDYDLRIALSGVEYRGVLARQWDDDNQVWVLGFTALSSYGSALWGSKVAALNAVAAPALTTAPTSQSAEAGGSITLTMAASGAPAPDVQWQKNGVDVAGATSATLTINSAAPADTGIYAVAATNFAGAAASPAAVVGVTTADKVIGTGTELQADIKHPNGNTFDQVLLTGAAEAITADYSSDPLKNQITRTSFIDVDDDIVQVEFSGHGTLSLVLDQASGPARPVNYNQEVDYMKGHAGIVITGADETTNVSVFTVGRATAFDPTGKFNILQSIGATNDPANNGSSLFVGHETTNYDGVADVAFIAIASTNGKFGGVRASNAAFFASKGLTGVYAPGVAFQGPVFVGNVTAFDAATPVLVLGSASDVRVTGGDLWQSNGRAVQVKGIAQLKFTDGGDSAGRPLLAKANRAKLEQDGVDVTAQIVVGP